jgi:hypothetical protein
MNDAVTDIVRDIGVSMIATLLLPWASWLLRWLGTSSGPTEHESDQGADARLGRMNATLLAIRSSWTKLMMAARDVFSGTRFVEPAAEPGKPTQAFRPTTFLYTFLLRLQCSYLAFLAEVRVVNQRNSG